MIRLIFLINLGKISLISALNYTLQQRHQFTVRATIGTEYSDTVVVVNVLDVNNNCPVFDHGEVSARLTTPVESGTIIAINKATDVDTDPILTYSIVAGDTAGKIINLVHLRESIIKPSMPTFSKSSFSDSFLYEHVFSSAYSDRGTFLSAMAIIFLQIFICLHCRNRGS